MGGKNGAVQFGLQHPHYHCGKEKSFNGTDFNGESIFVDGWKLKDGWKIREGAIFVEITSATGKNIYDWTNKIIIALSITDIGKVLLGIAIGQDIEIMHDPGAKSASAGAVKKFFNVTFPKGTVAGGFISCTQMAGGEKVTHRVPMTGDELITLKILLEQAVSRSLNW